MRTRPLLLAATALLAGLGATSEAGPLQTGTWNELFPATSPPPTAGHEVVSDGELTGAVPSDDTWEFVGPNPGLAYCFGDGSGGACPCGNSGGPGQGCANSTGDGGRLNASGTSSAVADDLTFQALQLVPFQPALLFVGDNALNGVEMTFTP